MNGPAGPLVSAGVGAILVGVVFTSAIPFAIGAFLFLTGVLAWED